MTRLRHCGRLDPTLVALCPSSVPRISNCRSIYTCPFVASTPPALIYTMAPTFETLPVEIHHLIASHLPNFQAFHQISRTSRYFSTVYNPLSHRQYFYFLACEIWQTRRRACYCLSWHWRLYRADLMIGFVLSGGFESISKFERAWIESRAEQELCRLKCCVISAVCHSLRSNSSNACFWDSTPFPDLPVFEREKSLKLRRKMDGFTIRMVDTPFDHDSALKEQLVTKLLDILHGTVEEIESRSS